MVRGVYATLRPNFLKGSDWTVLTKYQLLKTGVSEVIESENTVVLSEDFVIKTVSN